METPGLEDLEYRAEFGRRQFELYEARRLAEETHANAVVAAALAVGGAVLAVYGRKRHPSGWWLAVALLGLLLAFVLALSARFVSWETPPSRLGPYRGPKPDSDLVESTREAVNDRSGADAAARELRHLVFKALGSAFVAGIQLREALP